MKLTEGAVGFHLGNDGVDKDEEIVLPLAHQHTDFSVGERYVNRCQLRPHRCFLGIRPFRFVTLCTSS